VGEADPQDPQTVMRGDGSVDFGQDEARFNPDKPSPRLFIIKQQANDVGFENVEFTAYAKWTSGGSIKSSAGFTMIARTNHFKYKDDACNAAGYYMHNATAGPCFRRNIIMEGTLFIVQENMWSFFIHFQRISGLE
jgi:hypothetical protein